MSPRSARSPRRALLLAVAASALLFAGAAAPVASAAPRLPTFAGTVTVRSTSPSFVRVTVPRGVVLLNPVTPGQGRALSLSGPATTAFALVSDSATGPTFVGGRLPSDRRQPAFTLPLTGDLDPTDPSWKVPPGSYRLFLLSDGPAELTLRLRGTRGSSRLTASRPARALLQQPSPRIDSSAAKVVHSVGEAGTIAADSGLFFYFGAARFDVHTESSHSTCYFDRKPVGPNPYLPGCPTTGGGTASWYHFVYSDEYVGDIAIGGFGGSRVEAGEHGAGFALVSGAPAAHVGYGQVWLDL